MDSSVLSPLYLLKAALRHFSTVRFDVLAIFGSKELVKLREPKLDLRIVVTERRNDARRLLGLHLLPIQDLRANRERPCYTLLPPCTHIVFVGSALPRRPRTFRTIDTVAEPADTSPMNKRKLDGSLNGF